VAKRHLSKKARKKPASKGSRKAPAKKAAPARKAPKKLAKKALATEGTRKALPARSGYALHLSVDPGGARRHDTYVYRAWEHIRSILTQLLLSASSAETRAGEAYLAVSYGELIELSAVDRGVVSKTIDLRPHVQVAMDGGPWVALSDTEGLAKRFGDVEDYFTVEWGFRVDWEGIEKELPPLEGELFAPREGAARITGLFRSPMELKYGYSDGEFGNKLPPIAGFVDPDPPSSSPFRSTSTKSA
jgi:hypothetical protein